MYEDIISCAISDVFGTIKISIFGVILVFIVCTCMDFIQANVFYGAYIPFICQRVHNVKTMQFYFIIVNKLVGSFQILIRIYI